MATQVSREQSENRLAQKVGPFYDAEGVLNWLGVSRQAIHKRRGARTILGCRTADGRFIYPVWQFQNDGRLLARLPEVLKVLAAGIDDPWTWALWLQSAVDEELDGKTVTQWLRDGGDVEPVLRLARNDAAAWAAETERVWA
ncbi:hypothetical protein [Arthrobacter flavus]|uniref:Rv2175c C-terminal domain-containing protein n=2 Tax=Arthrobacter TaxID=1663 RepID=A0ABW4Q6W8_9MICC